MTAAVCCSRLAHRRNHHDLLSGALIDIPLSYPGVHAETWLVPAEHLPGPVPAAAPQKGPDAAQVHRRWHVRPQSNRQDYRETRHKYFYRRIALWLEEILKLVLSQNKRNTFYVCAWPWMSLHQTPLFISIFLKKNIFLKFKYQGGTYWV